MAANYLPYEPQQMLLLPESLQEWLPERHLAPSMGQPMPHNNPATAAIRAPPSADTTPVAAMVESIVGCKWSHGHVRHCPPLDSLSL